ncbi:hypothetical protein BTZ20_2472 [Rhodococcus sp. MTM3W5.2]|nr:hypothetical protein BTZ20_2472 [Rhodococcus sp. MTM3W5.2]
MRHGGGGPGGRRLDRAGLGGAGLGRSWLRGAWLGCAAVGHDSSSLPRVTAAVASLVSCHSYMWVPFNPLQVARTIETGQTPKSGIPPSTTVAHCVHRRGSRPLATPADTRVGWRRGGRDR